MEVQDEFVEGVMAESTSHSTPESEVYSLMQQVDMSMVSRSPLAALIYTRMSFPQTKRGKSR
ncbi:hypothetical protein KSP40_PGU013452 [Platanthera guangdongensis]|uniref:Uncharacterized protein n=1 Tax=Platanthera guangdongensis TaxID=2320717 RepID=A0ABR2LRD7_9ASPA